MESRRQFLNTVALGSGAVLLGNAVAGAAANEADSPGVATKTALLNVLAAVGKPCRSVTTPDGATVLVLPYGGRVLGLFAPESDENFYWTHPALATEDTARAFYAGNEWQNSGGDRTWLAPEVDIFLPNYPDTDGYFQPRQLDPGNYQVVERDGDFDLVNELSLTLCRTKQSVDLRMTKSVGPAANPLRYEQRFDLAGIEYAGYMQYTRLEMLNADAGAKPPVGLWNLVQMPHGGDLLIPVFHKTQPKIWFGEIGPQDLRVGDHMIRYTMRAKGEHKLGVRAIATTGRVGYLHEGGGRATLIVRNFVVNPSGEYVDVPWKDPNDLGYSTQACNVNSALGAFSELEYHIPAIGGTTGMTRCDDAAQVWAYRGPREKIHGLAQMLLGSEA